MNSDRCTFMTVKVSSFILSLTEMPQNFIPKMLYKINTDLSQATENTERMNQSNRSDEFLMFFHIQMWKRNSDLWRISLQSFVQQCLNKRTCVLCRREGIFSSLSESFMQDNHTRLVYTQSQALKLWSHTESSTAEKFPRAKFSLSSFSGLFQPAYFCLHSASWSFILTDIK